MGTFAEEYRFERLPSDEDIVSDFNIFRALPGREVKLVVWSDDIFGSRTHWWGGRTIPCKKTGCDACTAFKESRWNGWVLAKRTDNDEKVIFEFTPPAGLTLDQAFNEFGSLRGLQIGTTRVSNRSNAKVHVRIFGVEKNVRTIPKAPDIVPIMARIWGLKMPPLLTPGGMDSQPLSEAERVKANGTAKRGTRYNKVPQSSLLQAPPAEPLEFSKAELLDAIAKEAWADSASIKRVNGAVKK